MPAFVGPRRAMLGAAKRRYLLYDAFNDARAAAAVNATASTLPDDVEIAGTIPTRTVTDANSKLSIAGGVASFATGGVGLGDPGLWYPSQARLLGKLLMGRINMVNAANDNAMLGFDSTQAGSIQDAIDFESSSRIRVVINGTAITVGAYSAATNYDCCVIMRGTGIYVFIKGGAFTSWNMLWVSALVLAAGFPGIVANSTAVFTADNLRIPVSLYIPVPLAYDTFTRADAALGNSETTGPDAQTTPALAWTGTTYTISTNKAINTPTLGADVVVNGSFAADTNWTKAADWTIAAGVATKAAGVTVRDIDATVAPLVIYGWYETTWTLAVRNAGLFRSKVGGIQLGNRSAVGTYVETVWARSTAFGIRADAAADGSVDNVSSKLLTLSTLFASLSVSTPDVLADANVTLVSSTDTKPAGLVLNLDSAATPANFIVAYLDGVGNCLLDKCVAGVYTTVISGAVTYSAGATLRVIKNGTSYSLFYNGVAVGSTSTISDAGIVNNSLHGLFSTSPLNSLDNFQLFPRGTGNEFSGLDAF